MIVSIFSILEDRLHIDCSGVSLALSLVLLYHIELHDSRKQKITHVFLVTCHTGLISSLGTSLYSWVSSSCFSYSFSSSFSSSPPPPPPSLPPPPPPSSSSSSSSFSSFSSSSFSSSCDLLFQENV